MSQHGILAKQENPAADIMRAAAIPEMRGREYMPSDMDRLLLKFHVEERLAKFGRAVDEKAFSKLDQIFLPDVVGIYNGYQSHSSLVELIEAMDSKLGPDSACGICQHNVLNVEADFDGEGRAISRANFYALQEGVGDYAGQTYKTWGEYNDFWTLTPSGWRIRERRYTTFFNEGPKAIVGL
jgi:SnoaL-like domain